MNSNENLLNNELQVDPEAQLHLNESAKWAKFLGVIGFIFSGLILLAGLVNLVSYNEYNSRSYYYGSRQVLNPLLQGCLLLIIAVIWTFASLYLYRFATKMKTSLQNTDQFTFNDALSNLSKNYKFLGIVTIVYLSLVVLAVLAGALR